MPHQSMVLKNASRLWEPFAAWLNINQGDPCFNLSLLCFILVSARFIPFPAFYPFSRVLSLFPRSIPFPAFYPFSRVLSLFPRSIPFSTFHFFFHVLSAAGPRNKNASQHEFWKRYFLSHVWFLSFANNIPRFESNVFARNSVFYKHCWHRGTEIAFLSCWYINSYFFRCPLMLGTCTKGRQETKKPFKVWKKSMLLLNAHLLFGKCIVLLFTAPKMRNIYSRSTPKLTVRTPQNAGKQRGMERGYNCQHCHYHYHYLYHQHYHHNHHYHHHHHQ